MRKTKIIIILYITVITLFIIPVNAENRVINSNFTSVSGFTCGSGNRGCITDWTISDLTKIYTTETAYSLPYACVVHGAGNWLSQEVDLTGCDLLTFYLKCTNDAKYINLYIDGNFKESYYVLSHTYEQKSYDISSYSGIKTIKFESGYGYGYIDDVCINSSVPSESEISFYPTLTNITPTHINFSIIDSDASNTYDLTIYRNVSGTSTYIDYVGWHHMEVGSAPIQISEYGKNCTYYAKLYATGAGYNRYIATCEREYIFDGNEIDPFPDPDPTPIITPLPTYTPPPTPIPPDQPDIDNGTLNMSWLNGYYNLVDGITNGLFHPIYNMTAYIMMPVNILSGSISGFMNQMEISFNTVTNEILTATSILNLFFGAIPDKILNVMTYYLTWVVILLLVKGDT